MDFEQCRASQGQCTYEELVQCAVFGVAFHKSNISQATSIQVQDKSTGLDIVLFHSWIVAEPLLFAVEC